MPKFDLDDLQLQDYTPAVQNLWKVTFPNILGIKLPSFTIKTATRPAWSFEEYIIDYMGQKRYGAGKVEFEPFEFTSNEPVDISVTKALIAWSSLIQEFNTGKRGYVSLYKKPVTVEILDGFENVINRWVLEGAFPQSVNGGTLDYSTGEPIEVSCTLRYDKPIFKF